MGRVPFRFVVVALFSCAVLPTACRKDEPSQVALPAGAVGKCESGIRKAVTKPTVKEVMTLYYDECADLYTEAGCRDAFHAAAHAEVKDQVAIVMQGCRSAYCPLLGSSAYEACTDGFQVTPETALRAWPKLQSAILAHEAGAYSGEVTNMLMALYAYTLKLPPEQPVGSASGEAAGSATPSASAAPPSSAAPQAGGSAAPPGSASAAPAATAKAKKPAKP